MSNANYRVTVGLPVYNGERFLEETLRSLMSQTLKDFELIISDNASSDLTEEIGRSYAAHDVRIRYHRNSSNIGLAGNYNQLFRMSSGRYFKWATADDLCERTFLEQCVGALESDPESVLAYPRTRFIDENGGPLDVEDPGFNLRWDAVAPRLRYIIRAQGWVNAILGVIRSDALARTNLLPNYPSGDYVLLGQLAAQGKFAELPDRLLLRRIHGAASSQIANQRERIAELITGRPGQTLLPVWCRYRDHLRTVVRADMKIRDKLSLGTVVLRGMVSRRGRLITEAVIGSKHMARNLATRIRQRIEGATRPGS